MTVATQEGQSLDFQKGTHLKDYWKIILRRKWIVITFTALTTAAVGLMSFTTMPLYKASATIVIENEESDVLDPARGGGSKGLSYDIFENYIKTQMSLILSRSVAGKVFDEMHLSALPRYQQEPHPIKRAAKIWFEKISGLIGGEDNSDKKPDPLRLFLKDIELE